MGENKSEAAATEAPVHAVVILPPRETHDVRYLQVGKGGLCFAHGPFDGILCPQWGSGSPCPCTTDPQKPEYIAMANQQMHTYTHAELKLAIAEERERCAKIALSFRVGRPGERTATQEGQDNAAIGIALRIRKAT